MDELELLKKDWDKSNAHFKSYSETDIYPMLHRKSSSIVKTLFYISIAELGLWVLINAIPYLSSAEYSERLSTIYGDSYLMTAITILSNVIIVGFVFLLFKSHKAISVTDNAKTLMKKILNTRKVIKWYVIYNLILAFVTLDIGFYYSFTNNADLSSKLQGFNNTQMFVFSLILIAIAVIFVLVIWLFYKLLYGILLRRLNNNYKELKKLEV